MTESSSPVRRRGTAGRWRAWAAARARTSAAPAISADSTGSRTLVLLDARGGGASGTPAERAGYAYTEQRRDVDALRRHLGLRRVDVPAHSAGALTGRVEDRLAAPARWRQIGSVQAETPRPARGSAYAWLPAVLITVGTLLDLVTPPHLTLMPFYLAAPMVAAPLLSLRATAGYGLLATAAVAGQMSWRTEPGMSEATIKTLTVATIALAALGVNRIFARRDQRVASAREIAEAVQRAVVPDPPERVGRLRVAARYQAAQRNALVGGDLYAVRETPYGVRMLLGDVRGKGLTATEAVAVLLGTFREAAEHEPDLEAVSARLEAALMRERVTRPALDPAEGFTTAILVEVPHDSPVRVRVINRGHPPPVLLGPGGDVRYLAADSALPLGLGDLLPSPDRVRTERFPPGTQLLLYTDGVSEARDGDGSFYDPAVRLDGRFFATPTALLDRVVMDVVAHADGGLQDDMALLAVQHPVREPRDGDATLSS